MNNKNQKAKKSFWENYFVTEAGYNLSWGSIIAGTVTFIAVSFLLSLIGTAIGFGIVSPADNDPFAGLGIGLVIWTIVQLLISLFCGAFVAGLAARKAGLLHGFLTWSLSIVLTLVMIFYVGALGINAAGRVIGSVIGGVGNAASSVGEGAGNLINEGFDALGREISQVNTEDLDDNAKQILKDTEVPELQPDYLNQQLDATKEELTSLAKEIATNPNNAEQAFNKFMENAKARTDKIAKAVDRDAIAKAVSKNSELSEAEAKKTVDNVYNGIQEATTKAQEQLDNIRTQVEKTYQEVQQTIAELRVAADEASNKISLYSVLVFIGLIISMVLASFGGYLGSKKVRGTVLQD